MKCRKHTEMVQEQGIELRKILREGRREKERKKRKKDRKKEGERERERQRERERERDEKYIVMGLLKVHRVNKDLAVEIDSLEIGNSAL